MNAGTPSAVRYVRDEIERRVFERCRLPLPKEAIRSIEDDKSRRYGTPGVKAGKNYRASD